MGWYGDYDSTENVIREKLSIANRKNTLILDTKWTKSYGAILYQTEDKAVDIDFFIFRENMYKPLSWADRINSIPKVWISAVLPYASEYEKELYRYYLTEKEKKKSQPKLDDILVAGKKYIIWDKHEVTYLWKQKRTHVFDLNGKFTKFTNLKPDGVKEVS